MMKIFKNAYLRRNDNLLRIHEMLRITAFFIIIITCSFQSNLSAQVKKEYLDMQLNLTQDSLRAGYFREIKTVSDTLYDVTIKFMTGDVFMQGHYMDDILEVETGEFVYYYPNGSKESEGRFKSGRKVGTWKRWSFDGTAKSDRFYPENETKTTNRVSKPAEFPGGSNGMRDFISKNLVYPKEAQEKDIKGTVYVSFTVDAEGDVANPRIATSVHKLLDDEALRVVSMLPAWTPASKSGSPVDSSYILPITFGTKEK